MTWKRVGDVILGIEFSFVILNLTPSLFFYLINWWPSFRWISTCLLALIIICRGLQTGCFLSWVRLDNRSRDMQSDEPIRWANQITKQISGSCAKRGKTLQASNRFVDGVMFLSQSASVLTKCVSTKPKQLQNLFRHLFKNYSQPVKFICVYFA